MVAISGAVHLWGIKDRIFRGAVDQEKINAIFRRTFRPFSARKVRKELYKVSDKELVDSFFKWLLFYRIILFVLMVAIFVL